MEVRHKNRLLACQAARQSILVSNCHSGADYLLLSDSTSRYFIFWVLDACRHLLGRPHTNFKIHIGAALYKYFP